MNARYFQQLQEDMTGLAKRVKEYLGNHAAITRAVDGFFTNSPAQQSPALTNDQLRAATPAENARREAQK